MRIVWIGSLILLWSHALSQTSTLEGDQRFEANRLQLGTFRYSDSSNGQVVGESRIRIQRAEGGREYIFSNVVEGASDQHWKAVITSTFRPISAELTFGGDGEQHKAFDLSYSRNCVSGVAATRDHNHFIDRRIGEEIAVDTVDQRIDWAAVMALKSYEESETFTFHVYDTRMGTRESLPQ